MPPQAESILKVFKSVRKFLDGAVDKYAFDEDSGVFSFPVHLHREDERTALEFSLYISDCGITFCAVSVLKPDKNNIAKLAEFVLRANSDIEMGNFDLDLDEGVLSYKINVLLNQDFKVEEDCLDLAIQIVLETVNHYYPGILAVLDVDMAPREALEKCCLYEEDSEECEDEDCAHCHCHCHHEDFDEDEFEEGDEDDCDAESDELSEDEACGEDDDDCAD